MNRALAALTCAALLVLLVEWAGGVAGRSGAALGTVYAAAAIWGYRWVQGRGRLAAGTYAAGMLALGFATFDAAGAGAGATLLLLVLVIQAVLLLPLPWAVAVTAAVPLVHLGMPWPANLQQGVSTAVAAAFAAVLAALHLREQRARQQLADANAELRRRQERIEELAVVEERNRLARDIHDGLGHHLTVVGMQVQAARSVLHADLAQADALLAKAEDQAGLALDAVRGSVSALRGPQSPQPLSVLLQELAAQTASAGLPTTVSVLGMERRLPGQVEEALLRAAQEGLTNALKHSGARRARITVDFGRAGSVRLDVTDDGAGILGSARGTGGFGLIGLRERAGSLGGTARLLPHDGAPGSTLTVEIPA